MGFTHLDPSSEAYDALCSANLEERRYGAALSVSGRSVALRGQETQDPGMFPGQSIDQEEPTEPCHHCRRETPVSELELIGAEFSYCPECAGMSDADKAYEARIARAEDRADEYGWGR
jgi:hypothetical protein